MDDRHKTEDLTGSSEGGTDLPSDAGEDEGGAPTEGDGSHVRKDQKPTDK